MMVIAFMLYPDDYEMEMPAAMNTDLFWGVKPKYILDRLRTASQEWLFFERQKTGLSRWCQAAEARKIKKKVVSCRCL